MVAARYEVELTAGAEQDLEHICDYLADVRGGDDADALLGSFLDKIDSLEQFPDRGVIPKELEALGIHEFRQLLLAPYRIFYRVVGSKVYVVLIADGRRDMPMLLERRLLAR